MQHASLAAFPVVIELPVVWGEMDAMQHVNNIVYFRYAETARMEYFARIGLFDEMRSSGVGPILASTSCRFRRPLAYPDRVSVGTRIAQIDLDRFTMETLIVSHSLDDVAAELQGVIVMFNYREQKKVAIPALIRGRIEQLEQKG